MAFTLPTANNPHQLIPTSNTRYLASINTPTTLGAKSQGNLPLTNTAGQYNNNTVGATKGIGYEFQASQAGYDVSGDAKVVLWHNQFNAPNRIQVDTVGNGGCIIRLYSGTGTMPTDYRDFYVGGNDTPNAECIKGQFPFTIDLNDTTYDASNGTFDTTDITSYAFLTTRLNMAGTSTNWNYMGSMYVLDTTKASTNTPTFNGIGATVQDAADLLQGSDYTNKIGSWVRQVGTTVFIDMPFRIGDNTSNTTFDDEGYTIISPISNDSSDPRVRVTTQALRTYLNLRDNENDIATFSGTWIWQVRSPFDWEQSDSASVIFNSPTFKGMGEFTLGSSISGSANWDDVDEVILTDTKTNINGSTFKNPNGDHLLNLTAGAMTISNMNFGSYSGSHAILIDTSGSYTFSNVIFDESGINEIENTSGGLITITLLNGSTTPGVTNTSGTSTIVQNTSVTITGLKDNTEIRVFDSNTSNPQTELAGIEDATDGSTDDRSFEFILEAGIDVDIVVISVAYENERIDSYTIPSSDSSIPVSQRSDRNIV